VQDSSESAGGGLTEN